MKSLVLGSKMVLSPDTLLVTTRYDSRRMLLAFAGCEWRMDLGTSVSHLIALNKDQPDAHFAKLLSCLPEQFSQNITVPKKCDPTQIKVYLGGPSYGHTRLYIIHSPNYSDEGTVVRTQAYNISRSNEAVQYVLSHEKPQNYMIVVNSIIAPDQRVADEHFYMTYDDLPMRRELVFPPDGARGDVLWARARAVVEEKTPLLPQARFVHQSVFSAGIH